MRKKEWILAIDQGTSATKLVLFDALGQVKARYNALHAQTYPKDGWVEHDAEEIFANVCRLLKQMAEAQRLTVEDVAALSVTNQTETVVVWSRKTGKPIYPAIVWQCSRAQAICDRLEADGHGAYVEEKSGILLSPYYSAARITWILEHVPGAREQAEHGELAFGTIDSWLVYKLTAGKVHACDHSNASRTQLYNIYTQDWDQGLLDIFSVPMSMAPEIKSSDDVYGYTETAALSGLPICGVIGDSSGALIGQRGFDRHAVKCTYGTGSSVMLNLGNQPAPLRRGVVLSVGWKYRDEVSYVYEGNMMCTGATISWLVHEMQLIPNSAASEALAASLTDNCGVYLVPAFVGLSAPYWDSAARASIVGMSRNTGQAQIVRAGLESIVYQIYDTVDMMMDGEPLQSEGFYVDGGASANDFLMQFQADMLGMPVIRSDVEESSALGAAFFGGLGVGFWASVDTIKALPRKQDRFLPQMTEAQRRKNLAGWNDALCRTFTDYHKD